ncbi:MAG TPA: hypothetical protein VM432_01670, partial [Bdellovibrionales bacterium]|nr:hypothetical protein [Bdellovibrionales bacterium]
QKWLAKTENRSFTPPKAFHTSLVVQDDGHRLEKRTAGVTLPELDARGISASELVKIFERSFEKFEEEKKPTLQLSRLIY